MRRLTRGKLCNRSLKAKNLISRSVENKSKSLSGSQFGSEPPDCLKNGWSCASAQRISSNGSCDLATETQRHIEKLQKKSKCQSKDLAPILFNLSFSVPLCLCGYLTRGLSAPPSRDSRVGTPESDETAALHSSLVRAVACRSAIHRWRRRKGR